MKVEAPQAVLAAVANDQGRVVVFGDTGCLDEEPDEPAGSCSRLLLRSRFGVRSPAIFPDGAP